MYHITVLVSKEQKCGRESIAPEPRGIVASPRVIRDSREAVSELRVPELAYPTNALWCRLGSSISLVGPDPMASRGYGDRHRCNPEFVVVRSPLELADLSEWVSESAAAGHSMRGHNPAVHVIWSDASALQSSHQNLRTHSIVGVRGGGEYVLNSIVSRHGACVTDWSVDCGMFVCLFICVLEYKWVSHCCWFVKIFGLIQHFSIGQ